MVPDAGFSVPDAGIPAEAMTRFTVAEGRLYPMVMIDPVGFQDATRLVGIIADELRGSCADIHAVLRRRSGLIAQLPEIAAAATLNVGGVSADTVVDAASAIRCRELQSVGEGARAATAARPGSEPPGPSRYRSSCP